jgi:protease-4
VVADSIRPQLTLLRRVLTSYAFFAVVGVILGVVLAPVAWEAAAQPAGIVAVVPLEGGIDGESAADVSSMLRTAREDPEVKAVVLLVNSGGGTAAGSEELYLQTQRTAARKPVVASVDAVAASGAYYTIAPADYIYAKPSSIVGSIGVLATRPTQVEPNDDVATTGPNKLLGADEREFYYLLETMRRAFVGAIFEQRGDTLTLTPAELSEARIYSGVEGLENGLVDGIGDRDAAIDHAARLAEVDRYEVRTLRVEDETVRFVARATFLASDAPNKELVSPSYFTGEPSATPVFLMLPLDFVAGEAPVDSTVAVGDEQSGAAVPVSLAATGTERRHVDSDANSTATESVTRPSTVFCPEVTDATE